MDWRSERRGRKKRAEEHHNIELAFRTTEGKNEPARLVITNKELAFGTTGETDA
jgi:hypothetical protein